MPRFNLQAHLTYLKSENHRLSQREIDMYTAPGFPFVPRPDGATHEDEAFAAYWARQRGVRGTLCVWAHCVCGTKAVSRLGALQESESFCGLLWVTQDQPRAPP